MKLYLHLFSCICEVRNYETVLHEKTNYTFQILLVGSPLLQWILHGYNIYYIGNRIPINHFMIDYSHVLLWISAHKLISHIVSG
jgi:hypothetical protein